MCVQRVCARARARDATRLVAAAAVYLSAQNVPPCEARARARACVRRTRVCDHYPRASQKEFLIARTRVARVRSSRRQQTDVRDKRSLPVARTRSSPKHAHTRATTSNGAGGDGGGGGNGCVVAATASIASASTHTHTKSLALARRTRRRARAHGTQRRNDDDDGGRRAQRSGDEARRAA